MTTEEMKAGLEAINWGATAAGLSEPVIATRGKALLVSHRTAKEADMRRLSGLISSVLPKGWSVYVDERGPTQTHRFQRGPVVVLERVEDLEGAP